MAIEHPGKASFVKSLSDFMDSDDNRIVSWKWFKKFIEIYQRERIIQGENTRLKQTEQGRQIDVLLDGVIDHPWRLRVAGSAEGGVLIECTPAQVHSDGGSIIPDIDYTPITDLPAPILAVSASGTQYVYLELSVTLSDTDDFVTSGEVERAALKSGALLPSDNHTTLFYYLIGLVVDGVPVQNARYNMQVKFCDDGTATGKGVMSVGATA